MIRGLLQAVPGGATIECAYEFAKVAYLVGASSADDKVNTMGIGKIALYTAIGGAALFMVNSRCNDDAKPSALETRAVQDTQYLAQMSGELLAITRQADAFRQTYCQDKPELGLEACAQYATSARLAQK